MTETPTPAEPDATAASPAGGRAAPRRGIGAWLFDPARCFLFVGALGGLLLVALVPPFGGIDEPAHFVRAYQVSTGRLMPQTPPGADQGGGACIPNDLARDVSRLLRDYYIHVNRIDVTGIDVPTTPPPIGIARGCGPGERFVDFSAFGWNSPILYAPQAAVLAVARPLGIGTTGMVLLARLVGLGVYLGLVAVAIKRSPFARWGLCALALVPVALFQAGSGRSPDLMTTGVAFLVVVSALRALRAGTDRTLGSPIVERLGLCVLLGLLKPTYAVLSLCFLLPLAAPRRDRKDRVVLLVAPVVVAIGASILWQAFSARYFVCDTGYSYFSFNPDPAAQRSLILENPVRYIGEALASFWSYGGKYLREAATVGESTANWHPVGVVVALGAIVLAGTRRDPSERFCLGWVQRALLAGISFIGMLLLITGEHVYCAPVGLDIAYPPHARHFIPVLIPLVIALTPSRRSDPAKAWTTRIPSAALLLAVTLAFVWSVGRQMR